MRAFPAERLPSLHHSSPAEQDLKPFVGLLFVQVQTWCLFCSSELSIVHVCYIYICLRGCSGGKHLYSCLFYFDPQSSPHTFFDWLSITYPGWMLTGPQQRVRTTRPDWRRPSPSITNYMSGFFYLSVNTDSKLSEFRKGIISAGK